MCYGGCDCARCAGEPIKPVEQKKQWVQHISGQGEKWEVCKELSQADYWLAVLPNGSRYDLPKSEYRLCDPPEVWRDVTEECSDVVTSFLHPKDVVPVIAHNGSHLNQSYRLRKVQLWQPAKETPGVCVFPPQYTLQWAFIIEQKVSQ